MKKLSSILILLLVIDAHAWSGSQNTPFLGRWDFNIATPGGNRASWLGVKNTGGKLEVWYQPTGGNVVLIKDATIEGSHLRMVVSAATATQPATTWDLDAKGDTLTGAQKRGEVSTPLTGVRAPELKRSAPSAWSVPEKLFNGT